MEERQIIKTEDLIFDYTVFDENGDETGKSRVLSDINLSIKEGSFVAVLGHNGSGKSTLAKHFNGILIPSSGKVLVDERNTIERPVSPASAGYGEMWTMLHDALYQA